MTFHAYLAGIDWFAFYCLSVGLAAGWALRCLVERRRDKRETGDEWEQFIAGLEQ